MTFVGTGLYDNLKDRKDFEVLDTYDKSLSNDEKTQLRREALLTDLFITGTNAVTEDGCLVNLDMIGNRVGALTFGPKNVLVLTGRKDHMIPFKMHNLQVKALINAKSVTARVFTKEEYAQNHCQIGNIGLALDVMIKWIDAKS